MIILTIIKEQCIQRLKIFNVSMNINSQVGLLRYKLLESAALLEAGDESLKTPRKYNKKKKQSEQPVNKMKRTAVDADIEIDNSQLSSKKPLVE